MADVKGTSAGEKEKAEKTRLSEIFFVYTVYYFFMKMKAAELHSDFKEKPGRRVKRVGLFSGIYGKNDLGMSRNRFNRIISGGGFCISKEEKKGWEKQFKIDLAFFEPDRGKAVLGEDLTGWESHFGSGKGMLSASWAAEELAKVLGNISSYIGTPFYSIYFYLCNHSAWEQRSNAQMAIDCLKKAGLGEWEDIVAGKEAEKSMEVMEKHYRYFKMKLEIRKMEEKEKNK